MKAAKTRAQHKKHTGTSKHTSAAKHTPTAHKKAATAHKQTARRTALTAKAAKARALSLGEGVACCSAEALAASLRLAGGAVSDDDVLALHWAAGGDEDTGVSILAALEAASAWGLAGAWPRFSRCLPVASGSTGTGGGFGGFAAAATADVVPAPGNLGLILGLELPGPHAVLAEPGRWWSWGERYDPSAFPGAVVEEAWAVTW